MNPKGTNRKAVEALSPGDHISDNTGIHELVHRLPYSDGDGSPMHALTLRPLGKGEPWVARYAQGVLLHLATDGEIREHKEVGRRAEVANTLRKLADDIVAQALPVPRYSFTVGGVVDSRAELERWAEHLGVEIRMSGDIPVVDKETGGLTVHFQSDPEPAAEVASDAQAVMAGAGRAMNATGEVEVYEPPAEHQLDAGWKGDEPGECGVRCVCGVTFDGFDSLSQAVVELHKHIANPESTDAEPQDGHVYSCCGKTGRISRHESWCETNRVTTDAQAGA